MSKSFSEIVKEFNESFEEREKEYKIKINHCEGEENFYCYHLENAVSEEYSKNNNLRDWKKLSISDLIKLSKDELIWLFEELDETENMSFYNPALSYKISIVRALLILATTDRADIISNAYKYSFDTNREEVDNAFSLWSVNDSERINLLYSKYLIDSHILDRNDPNYYIACSNIRQLSLKENFRFGGNIIRMSDLIDAECKKYFFEKRNRVISIDDLIRLYQ